MVDQMLLMLMENKDKLFELLEGYGYCNIVEHNKYITFGRDADSSPKAIVIRTDDNDACIVHDYARDIVKNIINFIMTERNVPFVEVIGRIKSLFSGVDFRYRERPKTFGGLFNKVRKNRKKEGPEPIESSVLEQYEPYGNLRFVRDGISLNTQREFGIGYDTKNELITIPIYGQDGELIGVKGRLNRDVEDGELKYFYPYPCKISETLYGYSHNYSYLEMAETVYVFEAEKSVMQAYEFGVRNSVAIGSSSLSKTQCLMLAGLGSKRIVLMFDEGLDREVIEKNCSFLKKCSPMKEFSIFYWEPTGNVPHKSSPTDLGEDRFQIAINKELVKWKNN